MYWLQQIVAAAVISFAILLLSLLPARHVLLPLWPRQVNEFVVVEDGRPTASRELVMAPSPVDPARVLIQTRPLSVAAVEHGEGRIALGYPVGLRDTESDPTLLDGPLPPEFRVSIFHPMPRPGDDRSLLLMDANDQLQVIPLQDVRRLYYPNQLGLLQRAWFVVRRIQASLIQRA